jgi:hypothetical protein
MTHSPENRSEHPRVVVAFRARVQADRSGPAARGTLIITRPTGRPWSRKVATKCHEVPFRPVRPGGTRRLGSAETRTFAPVSGDYWCAAPGRRDVSGDISLGIPAICHEGTGQTHLGPRTSKGAACRALYDGVQKTPQTHRYQVTARGPEQIEALFAARAARVEKLIETA